MCWGLESNTTPGAGLISISFYRRFDSAGIGGGGGVRGVANGTPGRSSIVSKTRTHIGRSVGRAIRNERKIAVFCLDRIITIVRLRRAGIVLGS